VATRPDALKRRLAAGEPVLGSMVFEFFTPGIARICANAGAEFVMYCMEHTGIGFETLKPQFALCRALGVAPLVRVPATEYHFVARALDIGALGVMVPLVDTAEQAARIVSFTRYPPKGRRGAAFGFAHDDYLSGDKEGDLREKMRAIHERTLVICMIETRAGLENVDAIAAVDGVDVIWLGHFDLTNFLGIPGQFSHPQYRDAVKRIAAAASKHGKSAGYMAASEELGREYLGHGYRMIATGTDQALLQQAISQLVTAWKRT
jgi:2-keto-3-deoxy-L-rhamnonate aldolase RhmA